MVASQQGDVDVVERLLAAGADVEIVIPPKSRVELSWEGSTALMQASILGHADVVRQLLAAGARVEATNKSGQTALMLATRKKHVAVVQLLSAAGNDKRL
jgi:ankyrin repeat protein